MDKYHFIISSRAGKISPEKLEKKLQRLLSDKLDMDITITEHENHVKDLCNELKGKAGAKIIVCGGDGTINEAANVLAGSETPLGVIPTGTGNDFSRVLYDKMSLDEIINSVGNLRAKAVDLMDVEISGTDSYKGFCINILSLGLDSLILKSALDMKDRNPWMKGNAYFLAILKSLPKIELLDLKIDYVDKLGSTFEVKDRMILGAVCNGGFYGNGFNPNPNGSLDDGIFEIVFLRETPMMEIIPLILKYRKGKHMGNHRLLQAETISGEVSSKREFLSNVDGLVYKCNRIKWSVSEKKLNLFT